VYLIAIISFAATMCAYEWISATGETIAQWHQGDAVSAVGGSELP